MIRILLLHNSYQQAGGEDSVVRNERKMLEGAGHEVILQTVSNDNIRTVIQKLRTLMRVSHERSRGIWVEALIAKFRPDILHVHNFFPLLTPAVHEAAHRQGVSVVQTLHNYRLLCAAATFERDGQVCELCLTGSRANALRHRCYRGSLGGTVGLLAMQHRAISKGILCSNVDVFIALTEFARRKYIQGGLPPEKIVVKPNFVDQPKPLSVPRRGALFVGRLSREKGVCTLLDAWRKLPDIPLTIAGDGPLRHHLEASAPTNVRFLGHVDSSKIQREMARAELFVAPSLWYEGFPMTLVESFASGLPALVSRIGSLAEIIEPGRTGAYCSPADSASLAAKVRELFNEPERLKRMGVIARRAYEERYTSALNLKMLENYYMTAMNQRSRSAQSRRFS